MKKYLPKFLKNSKEYTLSLACQVCGKETVDNAQYCPQHQSTAPQRLSAKSPVPASPKPTDKQTEESVAYLKSMFENIHADAIRMCLRDSDGNLERAIDTLLNLQSLLPTQRDSARTPSPVVAVEPLPKPQPVVATKLQEPMYSSITAVKGSGVFTNQETVGQELLEVATLGNIPLVKHFFQTVRPRVTRDIGPALNACVNVCIERGHTELLSIFLDNGVSPDGDEGLDALYTPLMLSLETRQLACAQLLLARYNADPNRTNTHFSPLHLAVKYSCHSILDLLLSKGANVNKIDDESHQAPLHIAVSIQDYDSAFKLVQAGASVTIQEKSLGETPIHLSVRTCHRTREIMLAGLMLEKTISQPKSIDLQDAYGNTVLHVAVQRTSVPHASDALVTLVLDYHPNPTLLNSKGETPLDIITKSGTKSSVLDRLTAYVTEWKQKNVMDAFAASSLHDEEEFALRDRRPRAAAIKPLPFNAPTPENDPDWELVNNFKTHINDKIAKGDIEKEFEEIEASTADANLTEDFSSALAAQNLFKNRYRNILPYERTRVKLQPSEDLPFSDFISANWVSGEIPGSERAYIATQGPLQHTVEDFWRMIWEQQVKVIVMLSNLVENGREKVWQYWPEESEVLELSDYQIVLQSFNKTDQLISRTFNLREFKSNLSRVIVHLQYISWPDHGLPETTAGFSQIIDIADESSSNAPIAVHCSAGIGRTGVFCIAHSLVHKLRSLLWTSGPISLDVKQSVYRIRNSRAGMIQTKEQYVFCYLSLVERLEKILGLLAYKNQKWYHKFVDSTKAAELLKGKPGGTWLVRLTQGAEANPGVILICVAKNGGVDSVPVKTSEKGFALASALDQNFPSLLALLEHHKETFKYPLYR